MNAKRDVTVLEADQRQLDEYVEQRYRESLDYYWTSSVRNKRFYKVGRILTVVMGAAVTLLASLSSSSLLEHSPIWQGIFVLGTPVMAALLTIIAGFSQTFQWGSAWQNMVLAAQRLQGEFDRFITTPVERRNHSDELELLNEFVVGESETFFERMLGGARLISDTRQIEKDNIEQQGWKVLSR